MFRSAWVLIGVAAGVVALVASPQEPRFRGGTNTVSIYATVVDGDNRLVPDLTAGDFEIYDNGVRQPVAIFANDLQPITIVVMLDRSASMSANAELVRRAASQFVTTLLPTDRARIG